MPANPSNSLVLPQTLSPQAALEKSMREKKEEQEKINQCVSQYKEKLVNNVYVELFAHLTKLKNQKNFDLLLKIAKSNHTNMSDLLKARLPLQNEENDYNFDSDNSDSTSHLKPIGYGFSIDFSQTFRIKPNNCGQINLANLQSAGELKQLLESINLKNIQFYSNPTRYRLCEIFGEKIQEIALKSTDHAVVVKNDKQLNHCLLEQHYISSIRDKFNKPRNYAKFGFMILAELAVIAGGIAMLATGVGLGFGIIMILIGLALMLKTATMRHTILDKDHLSGKTPVADMAEKSDGLLDKNGNLKRPELLVRDEATGDYRVYLNAKPYSVINTSNNSTNTDATMKSITAEPVKSGPGFFSKINCFKLCNSSPTNESNLRNQL